MLQWQASTPVQLLNEFFERHEVKCTSWSVDRAGVWLGPVRAGMDQLFRILKGWGTHLRRWLAAAGA